MVRRPPLVRWAKQWWASIALLQWFEKSAFPLSLRVPQTTALTLTCSVVVPWISWGVTVVKVLPPPSHVGVVYNHIKSNLVPSFEQIGVVANNVGFLVRQVKTLLGTCKLCHIRHIFCKYFPCIQKKRQSWKVWDQIDQWIWNRSSLPCWVGLILLNLRHDNWRMDL